MQLEHLMLPFSTFHPALSGGSRGHCASGGPDVMLTLCTAQLLCDPCPLLERHAVQMYRWIDGDLSVPKQSLAEVSNERTTPFLKIRQFREHDRGGSQWAMKISKAFRQRHQDGRPGQ